MKKKLSMSYLDVLAWVNVVGRGLEGASVQNLYYKDGLLWLKLKPRGSGTRVLLMEPGRRVHLTSQSLEAPERLHPFAGGLRKYLRGGKVLELSTLGHDRIVRIKVGRGGEEYQLIVELVPRGVAVLLDKENKILYANEYKEMKDRKIKRLEKYVPPPGPSFDPFKDLDEMLERIKRGKDVVRGLIIGQKLPAEVAEEALYRAGIEKSKKPKELGDEEVERLKEAISEIYSEAMEGKGYLYSREGLFSVTAFPSKLLKDEGYSEEARELNEALDYYFTNVESEEVEEEVEERVERELEKLKKSIEKQRALAQEYKRLSEEYQELASLIAANYAEVLEQLNKSRNKQVKIKIGDKEVIIPKSKSLEEYIRELFSKSKEYEKKYKRALKSAEELETQLDEVREKVIKEVAKERARVRRREWYEKYHWLFTRSGFLAIGGRDASQNESVVRRYLDDEDYFLHAEVQGAPAVVLKTEGKEPSEEDLRDAAYLTACYSKAWKEGRGSVDVFYVKGSQVSKSPPPGQYVAKGAFIIKGKREYVKDVPLTLGIGVEIKDGAPRVIVGPPETVSRKAFAYAILAPGDVEKRKVAEKLKRLWSNKLENPELKGIIEGLKEDEIMQRIPGKSRVLKISVNPSNAP